MYNFDEIVDRRQTDSIKYGFAAKRGKPEGLLPLWVADMDFRAPEEVIDALVNRSRHGIFGYSEGSQAYTETVKKWFWRYYQWRIEPDWIVRTPGVVFAISTAIRALTREGDAVLIQPPVYYPFSTSILRNKRKLVENTLEYSDGKYSIDFVDFERKVVQNNVRLFILCSPHNPVGRVWTEDELVRMGEICEKHDVLIISDEIHADFVYPGTHHTVFANIRPSFLRRTVTCTAPSKTFNLAGLQISNIIIEDEEMRGLFVDNMRATGYNRVGCMALAACKAAYEYGDGYLVQLLAYLTDNLDYLRAFLRERLPMIRLVEPEGTYLVWLDFHQTGLVGKELDDFIVHKAKLWLDDGEMFGKAGAGFERINIACPRATLQRALKQLENAMKEAGLA